MNERCSDAPCMKAWLIPLTSWAAFSNHPSVVSLLRNEKTSAEDVNMCMLMLTGTLFVLMKDPSLKQQLLELVSSSNASNDAEIQQLIEKLQTQSPEKRPAVSAKTQGKWRLLWSKQVAEQTLSLVVVKVSGSSYRHAVHFTPHGVHSIGGTHCMSLVLCGRSAGTSHHPFLLCIILFVLCLSMEY